ncbi:MAG: AbrB family transcriptional regulator [Comamonadaceae bacterium]|nr:AbrB family transcriptional regulator [Comamonadaceae bacterium]
MTWNALRTTPALAWAVLVPASAALAWLFTAIHLPAAVLLGCMAMGIAFSTHDITLAVPPVGFALGQGLLGCLMAASINPPALGRVASAWPIFLLAASSVILASAVLGWIMMRRQVFPGTTAVWGLAPGAASAMVLMSESYGADVRLVAYMQYLRVAVVTATAALVARTWLPAVSVTSGHSAGWLSVHHVGHVGATLLLAVGGALVARRLRLPAGSMVLPLVLGTALQSGGWLVIELPAPAMVLAYALIGWSIGLRFTRATLGHAFAALPQVLGAIAALMAVGVLLAAGLVQLTGIDPLSAYLATSPGGADSVAVIAATSAVDAGFVMTMQLARFLMVLVFGPQVSRFVATRAG